jgi:hypothetical protein
LTAWDALRTHIERDEAAGKIQFYDAALRASVFAAFDADITPVPAEQIDFDVPPWE